METEHAKIKPIRPIPTNAIAVPDGTVVDMEPTTDIHHTDDHCLVDDAECLLPEDEHFNDVADGLSGQGGGVVVCAGAGVDDSEGSVQAMATDPHHDHDEPAVLEPHHPNHPHHHHHHHTTEPNSHHHHHAQLHHHHAHHQHHPEQQQQQHEKMEEHHDDEEVVVEQHPKTTTMEDKT